MNERYQDKTRREQSQSIELETLKSQQRQDADSFRRHIEESEEKMQDSEKRALSEVTRRKEAERKIAEQQEELMSYKTETDQTINELSDRNANLRGRLDTFKRNQDEMGKAREAEQRRVK